MIVIVRLLAVGAMLAALWSAPAAAQGTAVGVNVINPYVLSVMPPACG